ncbi:MAG: hypothetical protein B7X86_04490 [Sphingobacteriales bacterium 17-39-43]|uniref:DUF1801 domain-containing protein n=1 Tax=Daejeonella sp. TaxID=2805397 RepID=UPI000BD31919|nr:DUF1801 domain-containing protein [Daejeonella sp.]OYZ32592.1 MAG: hypothetical protein B7Y24_05315 [Sphingobacteriales bacterium 16-39-50]OZA25955.1 MAG: hypothetical protein B7X86_04490 [Sphingobacteriales bacterium 17-39-43]HQT21844.1 DUF1801 domain-containing protein [Daejeonella sp.]HQT57151.1 DUF1801 domain-containing protein [Daejeonella sp.]
MTTSANKPETIDEYISLYPLEVQELLQKVRRVIKKAAPEAKEAIKYQLPTFVLNGNLVHFGAFKNHIGFYPAPSGISVFKQELSVYESGKGSIQFPMDREIPYDLISRIVQFRIQENLDKMKSKGKKSSKSLEGFPDSLGAPARRALENNGIKTLKQLSEYREAEILKFHGMGQSSLPKLRAALLAVNLSFKS